LQGLSLLRHSVADELAYLSEVLVSSMIGEGAQPTLLEDIEALQRVLKELQSLRSYLAIVHRIVSLRRVSCLLCLRSLYIRSEKAVEHARSQQSSSVTFDRLHHFKSLVDYVESVEVACQSAQDEAGPQTLGLVNFGYQTCKQTWLDVKSTISE
jgi:RAD50-interacting protein 1